MNYLFFMEILVSNQQVRNPVKEVRFVFFKFVPFSLTGIKSFHYLFLEFSLIQHVVYSAYNILVTVYRNKCMKISTDCFNC